MGPTEADQRHFKKGQIIFKEGDFQMHMFDIRYGKVGVYKNYGHEDERLIATLAEGDFFGEMGLVEVRPRSATVVALEDTIADVITQENFGSYFKDKPAKVLSIMQHMSARIRYLTDDYLDSCECINEYLKAEESGQEKTAGLIGRMKKFAGIYRTRTIAASEKALTYTESALELRNKLLFKTFGKYLSDEIVRQLVDNPENLSPGGRKETLTILMSDLRGFTAMSERMPAQDLIRMLNHYLECMTEYIRRHNGTIFEFIGDGITAVFGAPNPNPNHASDAVAAAIDMQAHMDEINAWNKDQGFPDFKMGIGIHTCEVIIGNIGGERHMKYGMVGSGVNLTSRIESCAVGGQVLISSSTRDNITSELETAGTETVSPKGHLEPLLLYDITGIGDPYCLFSDTHENPPAELAVPIRVSFRHIYDKHAREQDEPGIITAASGDTIILSTHGLCAMDDLELDLGLATPVFARVIRTERDCWLLKLTSSPEGYSEWLNSVLP